MVLAPRLSREPLASSLIYTRVPYISLELFKGLRTAMNHSCILSWWSSCNCRQRHISGRHWSMKQIMLGMTRTWACASIPGSSVEKHQETTLGLRRVWEHFTKVYLGMALMQLLRFWFVSEYKLCYVFLLKAPFYVTDMSSVITRHRELVSYFIFLTFKQDSSVFKFAFLLHHTRNNILKALVSFSGFCKVN